MDSEQPTNDQTPGGKTKLSKGKNRSGNGKKRKHAKLEEVGSIEPENDSITTSPSTTTSNNVDNKPRKKGKAPQPGEEGYLTTSQRRKLRKQRKQEQSQKKNTSSSVDPSMKYIRNPKSAPVVQQAMQYFAGKKKNFPVYVGPLQGWRTVSKLAVRKGCMKSKGGAKKTMKCVIGLFKPNSHDIVAVPDCTAHHPSINTTISSLQSICNQVNIEAYDEATGQGYLRYVCINVERSTGKSQLTLVWNSQPPDEKNSTQNQQNTPKAKKELDRLLTKIKQDKETLNLHSVWVHYNAKWKHSASIFDIGSTDNTNLLWEKIFGPGYIHESLDLTGGRKPCPPKGEIKLCFPPNVFRQANLDQFTKIVISIRNYLIQYKKQRNVDNKPKVLELYGGVGTIALNIADLTSSLISSDENPHNVECFNQSISYLRTSKRYKANHCSYIPKDATTLLKDFKLKDENSEIVIVDPPRKGLDDYVLQSLIGANTVESGPKLIVYVSCGFKAFVRDCNALLDSKKWVLDECEGHILFPGSDAIETLAFFRKRNT